jgi:hypothetical protein
MSLFNKLNTTSLKSLKFGQKQTAGDNTKPYIVTDINTADKGINKFRLTKFDDGLIRGGAVGALNAGITDTVRISKFLVDFPKGPLFLLKQVGLQLSNPRLETEQMPTDKAGKGTFGKIVAGISNVANKLNNLVGGPSRIYNLGINTLAQVPLNAVGGHIVRHGFLPIQDESQKYVKVVDANNKNGNNRLERLKNELFKPIFGNKTEVQANGKSIIDDYLGGPKSVYGIGRTTIHRTTFTGDQFNITASFEKSKTTSKSIRTNILNYVDKPNTIYQKYKLKNLTALIDDFKATSVTASIDISTQKTSYGFIPVGTEPTSSFTKRFKYDNKFEPINTYLNLDTDGKNTQNRYDLPLTSPLDHIVAASSSYTPDNYGLSLLYKDEKGKDLTDANVYNKGIRPLIPTFNPVYNKLINNKVRKENFRVPTTYVYDDSVGRVVSEGVVNNRKFEDIDSKIIRLPLIKDKNDTRQYDYNINSLINTYDRVDDDIMLIKFAQLDPFTGEAMTYLPFSAYLSGYSETYNSTWSDIKYNGRSDFFFVFDSYKKTVSFKLQIPIFKPHDLKTKHAALETLQRGLAGKYLDNRLGGVITRIRLGHYLRNAACIINSLTVNIPEQASWDWDVDGNEDSSYAMLLEASFSITVIADDIPGFSSTTPPPIKEEKKPEVKKPEPKPNPKPVIDDKKPTVTKKNFLPVEPIKIDSTRVEKNQYYKGALLKKGEVAKNYKFQGFGGGQPGGGGAGDTADVIIIRR